MKRVLHCSMTLILGLGFVGCISADKAFEIDRSLHNQTQADLNDDIHVNTSPLSGLRSTAQRANACSTCAK